MAQENMRSFQQCENNRIDNILAFGKIIRFFFKKLSLFMFNNHSIQMHDQVNKNTLSLVILSVQGSRNLTALANNKHQTNEILSL